MLPVKVYLVRHGETEENRQGIIQGHLDTALNETGVKQAHCVAVALGSIPFTRAYSSDLTRAVHTAKIILEMYPDVGLELQEELRERVSWKSHADSIHVVLWMNINGQEQFMGSRQRTVIGTPRHGSDADHKMEARAAFSQRAIEWWKSLLASLEGSSCGAVLAVTHGGFIDTLVRAIISSKNGRLGEGVRMERCKNCSVTEIQVADDAAVVVKYADATHLAEDVLDINPDQI